MSAASSCEPKSLLVVRLGAMGDVIHTLPAVAALRAAFPETKIGWIIEERWAELLSAKNAPLSGTPNPARPVVNFLHAVNLKGWRKALLAKSTRRQISGAWHEVRDQHYDAAVDFQGAIKSAVIARFSGANKIFGFAQPREVPAKLFYGTRVEAKGTHVIEQNHSLAEAVAGKRLPTARAEFPQGDSCEQAAGRLVTPGQDFILMNPGAGWAAKLWPAERYCEVARALAADGYKILINAGPVEQELAEAVVAASEGAATAISCSVGELIALTRRARLFIGGDTGPLHLAAAMRVPVVALFGPTDPARNGPYGTSSVVLRNPASRTSLSHTSDPDAGLLKIAAEEVIAAARKLLKETHA